MRTKAGTARKPLVFVSHIHEESSVALVLQEHLSRMFLKGIDFFGRKGHTYTFHSHQNAFSLRSICNHASIIASSW